VFSSILCRQQSTSLNIAMVQLKSFIATTLFVVSQLTIVLCSDCWQCPCDLFLSELDCCCGDAWVTSLQCYTFYQANHSFQCSSDVKTFQISIMILTIITSCVCEIWMFNWILFKLLESHNKLGGLFSEKVFFFF
jgi:hypothetical protein